MNAVASALRSSPLRSRYRPILSLGRGGMAEVLLAVGRGPSGFNKLVVLKVMRKELLADNDLRQMFLDEARVSARLNHANVVQVYEVLDTSQPCIVMEYLDGQAMSAVQKKARGEFTLAMHLRVISESLRGLHYTHELCDYDGTPLNLVHRDVSPENVFITYDGHAKVLDFGIAKAADVPGQTKTGVIKGKLTYMPREQLLCETVDRRADIHAVGAMLWCAAAGKKLRGETAHADVMRALIEGDVPRPSTVRSVDPELESIVMKALAPDPEDRYRTALDLQREIDRYLAKIAPTLTMREVGELASSLFEENRAERSKTIHSSLSAPRSVPPPPPGEQPSTRSAATAAGVEIRQNSPKPWSYVAGVAALVLVVGGIAFAALRQSDRTPLEEPSSAPPGPQLVSVRVAVSPPEASVMIDGKRYGDNPVLLRVPVDEQKHQVRGVLTGYETKTKSVRFTKDVSIQLSLVEVAPPPPPPELSAEEPDTKAPRVGGQVRPPRPPVVKPPPSTPNRCDPPFYFENGIKQYKPGCI